MLLVTMQTTNSPPPKLNRLNRSNAMTMTTATSILETTGAW